LQKEKEKKNKTLRMFCRHGRVESIHFPGLEKCRSLWYPETLLLIEPLGNLLEVLNTSSLQQLGKSKGGLLTSPIPGNA
jgi:hypothetical protein